jgi:tetratricopeptide (TPR) repeat protein
MQQEIERPGSVASGQDAVVLARQALQAGKLDEAQQQFIALLNGPSAADAHKGIGDVLAREGRLAKAAEAYHAALRLRPEWPNVLNNLGNILKLQGDKAGAEQHYREALANAPLFSDASNNLGVLLAERGALTEAADRFRDAASAVPPAREAGRNLALVLSQLGRSDDALVEFDLALKADPSDGQTLVAKARLLRLLGRQEEAYELACRALRLLPGDGKAYLEAGQAALAGGKPGVALPYCRHAVEINPLSAEAHQAVGSALLAYGAPQEAELHLRKALALDPAEISALVKLGRLCEQQGRLKEAEEHYRAAIKAAPASVPARNSLGSLLLYQAKPAEALAQFEKACEITPQNAVCHNNRAGALSELSRYDEAVAACETALQLNPCLAEPYVNLGAVKQTLGDLDQAYNAYERALEINPDLVQAIFSLSNIASGPVSDATVSSIEKLLESEKLPKSAKSQLHFALARIYERNRNFAAAFEAAAKANTMESRRAHYEPVVYKRFVTALKDTFATEFFEKRRAFGSPADRPIFIVGMPRSGTTLIEQVLATHPQVFGGGELFTLPELVGDLRRWGRASKPFPPGIAELEEPDVLRIAGAYRRHTRAIAGPTYRVTDKMPSNTFYLGLVALLFPSAKIIHCRRNPLDVFISSYFMMFRNPLPYSGSQRDFAHFYKSQEDVMAHWRRVLPIRIHEVDYENFVGDQEAETKTLLEYCELEWDPRCLDFHLTKRPVRTGSDVQVRRPLHAKSVGRSEPYAEHLKELERLLSESNPA